MTTRPEPPHTAGPLVDSRGSYQAALRWGFAQALAGEARRICCVDEDFADWPWSDADLLRSLVPWLRLPQRRLVLVARQFDTVRRLHPRFVAWRADWVHAIETWTPSEGECPHMPWVLVDDRATLVHRQPAVGWCVSAVSDPVRAHGARQALAALWPRFEASFPVKALGL